MYGRWRSMAPRRARSARAIRRQFHQRAIESCSCGGVSFGSRRWMESPPRRNCSRHAANASARYGRPTARGSRLPARAATTASSECTTWRRTRCATWTRAPMTIASRMVARRAQHRIPSRAVERSTRAARSASRRRAMVDSHRISGDRRGARDLARGEGPGKRVPRCDGAQSTAVGRRRAHHLSLGSGWLDAPLCNPRSGRKGYAAYAGGIRGGRCGAHAGAGAKWCSPPIRAISTGAICGR